LVVKNVIMTSSAIKKEVEDYLPLLSDRQQKLVLEMIKTFLNLDDKTKRISKKQYNLEIVEAAERIEKGKFFSHDEVILELSK
jgi:hypothetical protein